MRRLRIALCQLDLTVGDLDGNAEKVVTTLRHVSDADCDLAVFPELTLAGYPPEDLVLKPGFVGANQQALVQVASRTGQCAAFVGFVDAGRDLHNAAALCANGDIVGVAHKRHLPNYGVFDERRTFAPGIKPFELYTVAGVSVGLTICEDIWTPSGPVADLAAGGAEVVLNINASPYYQGRLAQRKRLVATRAADASATVVYVNLVGGQDELVFDGASFVVDEAGELVAQAPQFEEDVMIVDLDVPPPFRKRATDPRERKLGPDLPTVVVSEDSRALGERRLPALAALPDPVGEVYAALRTGLGDYVRKNGFDDVVVGLSGGVDSALVATVATDALGTEAVHGVGMPSRYSSEHSVADAHQLATNLGIDWRIIPIEAPHQAFEQSLVEHFEGRPPDLTEENLQSRIRGVILMALSNKLGWLLLATSNKSESAVGYATLYGDTAGGFAVLKDVPKLLVYELCRWRNRQAGTDLVPAAILDKPPSAELRPDQRDDQSLPPYEVLDPILQLYVEEDRSIADICDAGYDADTVKRVVRLVDGAEYKRRQTAPGVRITTKAFGRDRRLPITNRFRG